VRKLGEKTITYKEEKGSRYHERGVTQRQDQTGQIPHKRRPKETRHSRISRGDLDERGGGDCRQPSIRLVLSRLRLLEKVYVSQAPRNGIVTLSESKCKV
jgi:hypothetical protein